MKPVDDAQVWSIVCFVVPSEFRGQGVAHDLLRGAIAWARKRGVKVLEAYPVVEGESLWFGVESILSPAGFREVARRKPDRPVMRLAL
jgi:GNAT superfamily N-acetyltransferase